MALTMEQEDKYKVRLEITITAARLVHEALANNYLIHGTLRDEIMQQLAEGVYAQTGDDISEDE